MSTRTPRATELLEEVEGLDASIRRQELSLLRLVMEKYPEESIEILKHAGADAEVKGTSESRLRREVELVFSEHSDYLRRTDRPIFRAMKSLLTLWKKKDLTNGESSGRI